MRAIIERAGSVADKLLGLVVPRASVQAADCGLTCCKNKPNYWQQCCSYPGGAYKCLSCYTSADAARAC